MMPLCPTPPRAEHASASFKHPKAREKGPRPRVNRSKDEVRVASAPRGHRKDKYTTDTTHAAQRRRGGSVACPSVLSHRERAPRRNLEPQIITGSWSSGK